MITNDFMGTPSGEHNSHLWGHGFDFSKELCIDKFFENSYIYFQQ